LGGSGGGRGWCVVGILSHKGKGTEFISTLLQGGLNFTSRPTLLILEPLSLKIIIAQSHT